MALIAVLYLAGVPWNPLAFYIDEASIAYNAFTIAQGGRDEHGEPWPLCFRAFGEYKNPTLIYLLAGFFKVFGPGVLVARLICAAAGLFAVILLGRLAAGSTESPGAGILVATSAALTPWLFETSRLVFEVALYPLALVLFLLALWHVRDEARWKWRDGALLAAALALLTYTYSIGRLLAPLLALGLVVFGRPGRWSGIARTWGLYALLLAPLVLFVRGHPGALSARFDAVSATTRKGTWADTGIAVVSNYLGDLSPRRLLLEGDPNLTHHVPGMGSLLAGTVALAVGGMVLLARERRRDPFWRFVLYGFVVSLVPAALTDDRMHTLRLISFPVFLLLLTGPAWAWLLGGGAQQAFRQSLLVMAIGLTVAQGAAFQKQYYRVGPLRSFDLGYRAVFEAAVADTDRTVFLLIGPGRFGYIQALWQGVLRGMDTWRFVRLSPADRPPPGAVVVGEMRPEECGPDRILRQEGPFVACTTPPAGTPPAP